ncbi:hypothetical protein [Pedobacter borealis]|uniref:hypothetical protein n=1 Tax=Pedobacter borealis TaxID=475254 RepID=UPI00049375D5|nr:hypothetical protein [Pedobacter borealis]
MPLYDFTSSGIGAKLADLYVLDDSDLLTEARAMATDIVAWLYANFNLTLKQQDYIGGAPAKVKFYWGAQFGAAIIGRSVIWKEDVPNYGPPRRTKQIVVAVGGGNTYFPPLTGIGDLGGATTLSLSYIVVD